VGGTGAARDATGGATGARGPLETTGTAAVGADGPPAGRAGAGAAFFVAPEIMGRSGSSRAPSDAGKSEGSSGRIGGSGAAGRTGGAIAGGAARDTTGGAVAPPAGATGGVGAAGATPTIVFLIAAIVEGGAFAEIVGAAWTPGAAGDGTLIGSGSVGGLGAADTGTGGALGPMSPPTPTIVDLSGFLGRGASTREAPGGAIGGAAAGCGLGETVGAAGGLAAGGGIGGGPATAGLAGVVGLAAGKSTPGAVTRKECPHLGHRIFRPAGGTRRSSI
jgi:hypothetical protein